MSPAHANRPAHDGDERERRWPVVFVVAAVIVVVAVVAGTRGAPAPASALSVPSALVSPPDAESSAWYCTGQTTGSGLAPGFLVLTNATARAVRAEITSVTDGGSTVRSAVVVPAQGVIAPTLPSQSTGTWAAETVTLAGGGVAVSQAVHGSTGWSVAPCQSTTSASWYFAGGSTAAANDLYVSLLNPTSSPVVVDLGFVTAAGIVHPLNYQGVVLAPGAVLAENVSAEVQNAAQVSTVVTARTGRVVAAEMQTYVGGSSGLSIVPGVTQPETHWALPLSEEVSGGASEIDVFNPGSGPENVTLHLRLGTGALSPLSSTVAAGSTWVVTTSQQTRIPVGEVYSAEVDASGGPGVVVSRAVGVFNSTTSPQAGLATAVGGLASTTSSGEWVVPPPGTSASPAISGAAPSTLALLNVSGAPETISAYAAAPGTHHLLVSGTLEPGASEVVPSSTLAAAGFDPIVVRSSGALAVSEDLSPSARVGAVTMPGIPLAAALGL